MKTKIIQASRLSNFHSIFRTLGHQESSTSLSQKNPVLKRIENNGILCLLISRLWNRELEALEGLLNLKGNQIAEIEASEIIVGSVTCNLNISEEQVNITVKFRSIHEQISKNCVSMFLNFFNEVISGRFCAFEATSLA